MLLVTGANGRKSCGWMRYQATSSDGWRWRVWLLEACGLTQSEETIVAQRLETLFAIHPIQQHLITWPPPVEEGSWGVFGQCERSRKSSDCDACLFTCGGECVYMKSEWLWATVDFLLFEVHNKKWEREKSLETTLSFFPADKSTIAAGALRYRLKAQ